MHDRSWSYRAMGFAARALATSAVLAAPACGGGETPGDVVVEQGEAQVSQRGCPSCHQSSDAKDGVLSGQAAPLAGTSIYGPNLTPDHDTGIGTWTDAQILRAMREGLNDKGDPLCTTMPHFGVSDGDGQAIVAYLRSLAPVKRDIPASRCRGAGR